jgi:lysophospholipase L1-like esterase
MSAVKILVLGNSDTDGSFAEPHTLWPEAARRVAERELGEAVELTEARFAAAVAGADAYAERRVREAAPDVVILPMGTFAFSVGFVSVRVRARYGKRAGDWYKRLEDALDRRTRRKGGRPGRGGMLARRAARRIIGTQPQATADQLAENYRDILRALSRVEHVDVALVSYPPEQGPYLAKGIASGEARRRFLAAVRAEAARLHYTLIDDSYAAGRAREEVMTPDGFHMSAEGHRLLGEAVGAAIVALRARVGA